jgi:hypothetical protein
VTRHAASTSRTDAVLYAVCDTADLDLRQALVEAGETMADQVGLDLAGEYLDDAEDRDVSWVRRTRSQALLAAVAHPTTTIAAVVVPDPVGALTAEDLRTAVTLLTHHEVHLHFPHGPIPPRGRGLTAAIAQLTNFTPERKPMSSTPILERTYPLGGTIDRPSTTETAFHEAGHTVVAADTLSVPRSVELGLDDNHRTWFGRTVTDLHPGPVDPDLGLNDFQLAVAATLFAGHIAVNLGQEWDYNPPEVASVLVAEDSADTSDHRQILDLVEPLSYDDAIRDLTAAQDLAIHILTTKWGEVEAVAAALEERGHLDRNDIYDLIDESHLYPRGAGADWFRTQRNHLAVL